MESGVDLATEVGRMDREIAILKIQLEYTNQQLAAIQSTLRWLNFLIVGAVVTAIVGQVLIVRGVI